MDPWDFLKFAAPLAAIVGGVFALVREAFRWNWRLAQVEQKAQSHDADIAELGKICSSVSRMEVILEQLAGRSPRRRIVHPSESESDT